MLNIRSILLHSCFPFVALLLMVYFHEQENNQALEASTFHDLEKSMVKVAGECNFKYSIKQVKSKPIQVEKKKARKLILNRPFETMKLSEKDYEALERIIEAEAGGEDEKGKILVVQVILNRVNHPEFADTVGEVIFEKIGGSAQFSPILDGRYFSVTVSDSSKLAVSKGIYGKDYSKGALFFTARNQSSIKNIRWFEQNLLYLYKHGGHEFYTLP